MTLHQEAGRPKRDMTPSLIVGLREGHAEAGMLLDELYRPSLVRFCTSYLRNRDEAEDLVQDVFYRVLKSATIPENFRAWIYQICRSRCLDVLKARARRRDDQTLPTGIQFHANLTGALTRLVRGEQGSRLGRLFMALPEEYREVLYLRLGEGLPRSDIAQVLGISEMQAKYRLFQGLKRLREHTSLVEDG